MFASRIEGFDSLARALEEMAEHGVVFTRVDGELFGAVSGVMRRNFDTRGGLVGGWPKLSPKYAKRKRAVYGDRPIMQATGGLFSSLTQRGGTGGVFEVTAESVAYGSTLPHAARRRDGREVMPPAERFAEVVGPVVKRDAERHAKRQGFEVKG